MIARVCVCWCRGSLWHCPVLSLISQTGVLSTWSVHLAGSVHINILGNCKMAVTFREFPAASPEIPQDHRDQGPQLGRCVWEAQDYKFSHGGLLRSFSEYFPPPKDSEETLSAPQSLFQVHIHILYPLIIDFMIRFVISHHIPAACDHCTPYGVSMT